MLSFFGKDESSDSEKKIYDPSIEDNLSYEWAVFQVISGKEKNLIKDILFYKDKLNLDVKEAICPVEKILEIKNGKTIVSSKNLWPGYIFVNMKNTNDTIKFISRITNVFRILGKDSSKRMVTDLSDILNKVSKIDDSACVRFKKEFSIGSVVKITKGVFENFSANVIDVCYDKGTLTVEVMIFGRKTKIEDLKFDEVDEVD